MFQMKITMSLKLMAERWPLGSKRRGDGKVENDEVFHHVGVPDGNETAGRANRELVVND